MIRYTDEKRQKVRLGPDDIVIFADGTARFGIAAWKYMTSPGIQNVPTKIRGINDILSPDEDEEYWDYFFDMEEED